MIFGELMDKATMVLTISGFILAFRYLDGRAKARKKFRKPKYKSYKLG